MSASRSSDSSCARAHLRVVAPDSLAATKSQPQRLITRADLTALAQRPGERLERWRLPVAGSFAAVARAAAVANLPFNVAAALVIERRLVIEELADFSAEPARRLDWVAAHDPVPVPRSAPWRSYLRVLAGSETDSCPVRPSVPPCVGLPIRLTERLAPRWPMAEPFTGLDLESSLAWERQAVGAGLTLTEWAYRVFLLSDGRRSAPEEVLARHTRIDQAPGAGLTCDLPG